MGFLLGECEATFLDVSAGEIKSGQVSGNCTESGIGELLSHYLEEGAVREGREREEVMDFMGKSFTLLSLGWGIIRVWPVEVPCVNLPSCFQISYLPFVEGSALSL
jgi:hypothetical protein